MTEETRDSSLGEEAVENQGSLEPTPQSNEVIPATFPEQETGPWSQRSNRGTTPWSDPMHQIAVGLILSGLSFRILYLQYLLPLIGVLFLYFGLRQLREENLYFKRASIIVIIRLFLILTGALVGPLDFDGSKFMAVSALVGLLALVQLVLAIMLPWSLHKAVEEVYSRATQVPPRKPFRDSLIFFVFLIPALLALFLNPLLGVVTLLTLLVWGIQILYSMYRLGTQMDELPFGCTPAPVKMKMAHFSVLYSVLFVFLLLFSGVSSARLPLDPWAYIPTGMDESRQALVEAGMPEHIALDLEEQEVSRFLEAEKIIVSKNQFQVDASYNVADMDSYLILAQLPTDEVLGLSYFSMEENLGNWKSGYQLTVPINMELSQVEGTVLYLENGVNYTADFPRLNENWSQEDVGLNQLLMRRYDTENTALGVINYPINAEKRRGYVLFTLKESLYYVEQPTECEVSAHFSFFAPWDNLDYKSPEQWVLTQQGKYKEHNARFALQVASQTQDGE